MPLSADHPYRYFSPASIYQNPPLPYTAPFNPSSLSGLVMWQDASLLSGSDYDTIYTWPSANSYTAYMSGAALLRTSVLNGKNVLQFDGGGSYSYDRAGGSALYYTGYALFFVSRQLGGTNGRVMIGDQNILYGYWNGYKNQLYINGTPGLLGGPGSDTSWDIYTINQNGAGIFNQNGTLVLTYGSSANGLYDIHINTGGYYGNEKSDAQVAEVLIYNRQLTGDEYKGVEGYLAWKWGLQGNLPSNHPYKTIPL